MTTLSSANTLALAIRSIRLKYARVGIRASCSLTTSISSIWRIDRRALDRFSATLTSVSLEYARLLIEERQATVQPSGGAGMRRRRTIGNLTVGTCADGRLKGISARSRQLAGATASGRDSCRFLAAKRATPFDASRPLPGVPAKVP
jgi:hypothetical protein